MTQYKVEAQKYRERIYKKGNQLLCQFSEKYKQNQNMLQPVAQLLVSATVLLLASFVNGCTISARISGNTFYNGRPGMVDVLAGERVTVQCQDSASQEPVIRFNNSELGVVTYMGSSRTLTPETFKAGFYSCVCKNAVSKPLALVGEYW